MTDTSSRRRWTGRLMLGAAVIALPLTASVTYAESIAPEPPVPPAPPSVSVAPPPPPAPPAPPVAVQAITEVDPDIEMDVEVDADRVEQSDEDVVVVKKIKKEGDAKTRSQVRTLKVSNKGEKWSAEEREAMLAELRAELAEMDKELEHASKEIEKAVLEVKMAEGAEGRTVVKMECRGNSDQVAEVEELEGEVRKVYLCESRVMAHALKGLKQARKEIANNPEITGEMRADILKELDQQIANWADKKS